MAAEKRKEEEEEELASRNRTGAQQNNEVDESDKNPVHINDSNLPPVNSLTAFSEPLPPPPSYEEVVRATIENLPWKDEKTLRKFAQIMSRFTDWKVCFIQKYWLLYIN